MLILWAYPSTIARHTDWFTAHQPSLAIFQNLKRDTRLIISFQDTDYYAGRHPSQLIACDLSCAACLVLAIICYVVVMGWLSDSDAIALFVWFT